MRLLLDTHVFLCWLANEPLDVDASRAISDPSNGVWVSAATVLEVAVKRAAGRLEVDADPILEAESNGFSLLGIDARHAVEAGALRSHHRDPFDRMLVAQAQVERMTLVTRDQAVAGYDVALMPA
jgi:PIN domain nuclease of toxin-antitoxin system